MRFFASIVLVSVGALPAVAQASCWTQFHDAATGLSFRYPLDLHICKRNPQKFGLPNVQTIVDLIGDTKVNPGTTVLRFLVKRGSTTPEARKKRLAELHRACKSLSYMTVDGHKAVVCTSSGSAAIHWSIEILLPRECTILTLLGGADADESLPPPHNGEFPLLFIIHTVRFTSLAHRTINPGDQ